MWLLPAPQRPQPSPETYPVRGIDISAHNGEVDFGRVADSGMEFVIMKATEGATFKDSRFGANYRAAREARASKSGPTTFSGSTSTEACRP